MSDSLNSKLVQACGELGIEFKNVPHDGEWHRTDLENDPKGKDDASIKIFVDGRGGIVKNWKSGESRTVFAEITRLKPLLTQSINKSGRNPSDLNKLASRRARKIWEVSVPAPDDHGYLIKKQVAAYGARVYKGMLVVPVMNNGEIQSLQFISSEGKKSFLKNGRVEGGHYVIGEIK